METAFRLGHDALFSRDLEAAKAIPPLDKQIDQFYRQIELDCATLMTLQSPVAEDLRLLSAFMQLVRDLERIGDYAENLGEISLKIFPYPPHQCMEQIEAMSHQAQTMLEMSLMALSDLDAEVGLRVKGEDDFVDDAYDRLYEQLACQHDVKGAIEPIVLLVLAIRHIERMADHATNVGQRVAYIVTGKRA